MPLRTPKGRWRATRREALHDAVDQGLAEPDEHVEGRVYLHALAEIEEQE
jgi:hypothetical protein